MDYKEFLKRQKLQAIIIAILGILATTIGVRQYYVANRELLRLDHDRMDEIILE